MSISLPLPCPLDAAMQPKNKSKNRLKNPKKLLRILRRTTRPIRARVQETVRVITAAAITTTLVRAMALELVGILARETAAQVQITAALSFRLLPHSVILSGVS